MPYCMYLRKSRKDSENPNFTDEEILSRHQQLLEETAERQGLPGNCHLSGDRLPATVLPDAGDAAGCSGK